MYAFDYHRPTTLADATSLLGRATDGKLMAGGQTLIPTLKQRLASPSDVIDLSAIGELSNTLVNRAGRLVIGALATHASVANSADVKQEIPALAYLAGQIGDPQVRSLGTIGGSIANADPAADYPAAIVGLDAQIQTNKRTIAADDFFTAMFETALAEDEIVTEISFPTPSAVSGPKLERAGYAKFPNPASRYAIVGVMVAQLGGQTRVAVTGAGPSVFRVSAFESALAGNFAASALDGLSVAPDDLNGDIHASAEYRAHLVKIMAQRAVAAAN